MMQHRILRLMTVMATLLVAITAVPQQPFDLDMSFRTTISERGIGEVYVLENGQMYITGYMIRYPGQLDSRSFLRINPDGSRDDTFPDANRGIGTITPWNGGYYVGGNPSVKRLFSDASPDTSYHNDSNSQLYITGQGADYHVNPDGSIIRTGTYILFDSLHGFTGTHRLIFLTNTGHLDTTKTHRTGNANVWKIQALSTGKLMCSILGTGYDGQTVKAIFRIEANGDLDPTFYPTQLDWGRSYAFNEQSDGSLIVGGHYFLLDRPDTLCVLKFSPTGQLDPDFHIASFTGPIPSAGTTQTVLDILEVPNQRMIAVGNFDSVDGYPRSGIVMLHADGTVDTTVFNDAGCGPFNYQPNGPNGETYPARQIVGITVGPDGNYYIYGSYVGYTDGTNDDPSQRFVSRLYGLSVGIAEHQKLNLKLYPNPANTAITLQLENVPNNATVLMRDALGREVFRQRITGHYTTLGTAGLGAGVYVVEVWESGQRVGVERVVLE